MTDNGENTIPFHKRLSWRSAKIAVITTLIIGTLFAVVQVSNDISNERERIQNFANETLISIGQQAARAAYRLDETVALDIIKGLVFFQGVKEARLVDDFGDVLAHSSNDLRYDDQSFVNSLLGSDVLIATRELYTNHGKRVGTLEIEIWPAAASPGFSERTVALVFSGFVKGALLSIVLTASFHLLISRRILAAASSFEEDVSDQKPVKVNDEIDLFLAEIQKWRNALDDARKLEGRNQDWFRLAASSAGIGFWEWHIKTGELIWDDNMQRMYEMPEGLFSGSYTDWSQKVHPDDLHDIEHALSAFLSGEKEFNTEFRIVVGENRSVKNIMADATIVRDKDGHPDSVVGINRDVTARRSLEASLNRSQRMEAIGKLTGGVAHDFNNSLQAISGHVEFLKDFEADNPAFGRHLTSIERSANRAASLTQRLLAFARKQTLKASTVNVVNLIDSLEPLILQSLGKTVHYHINADGGDFWIKVDGGQLEDALINLVINSKDAMSDGGELMIDVRSERRKDAGGKHADWVAISVSDTGTGIAPDLIDKIYDPFFTTKGFGEGSGLGLSMVYGFVKQSGGEIQLESQPAHGTTFKLCFPATPAPKDRLAEEINESRLLARDIVLVEDSPEVATICVEMLRKMGHRVTVYNAAEDALNDIRSGHIPDLVISDIHVDGPLNGFDFASLLGQDLPNLPVLFMTGYNSLSSKEVENELSKRPVIRKPFTSQKLAQSIDTMLDGRTTSDGLGLHIPASRVLH